MSSIKEDEWWGKVFDALAKVFFRDNINVAIVAVVMSRIRKFGLDLRRHQLP